MTDRAALLIGVNESGWGSFPPLFAPANDILAMRQVLEKNEDGGANLKCETRSSKTGKIDRDSLSDAINRYLGEDYELLVIYFAGHAIMADGVAGLVTAPGKASGTNYLGMRDLLDRLADPKSKVRNAVILLDCCHAGAIMHLSDKMLPPGVAIFAAAGKDQEAIELPGQGKFTKIVIAALAGEAKGPDGRVTAVSLYEYLDRKMVEAGQRPIFATHLERNITLRKCAAPEAAPLSSRTAKGLYQLVKRVNDDQTVITVSENAKDELKRFDEICQKSWRETETLDCLSNALEGSPFGAYVHARALLKGKQPDDDDATRYLSCAIKGGPSYTLLQGILGDKTAAGKESKKEDFTTMFTTAGLAHWLLTGIFKPRPIAVALDFSKDQWKATLCELYAQKLALTIELGGPTSSPQNVLAALKKQAFGPVDDGIDHRLESLGRMKDPQDKEFYVSYMGPKIKSNLILPSRGRPGVALELLLPRSVVISPLDGVDDESCIRLKVDEIMMMLLATERLRAEISRRYAQSGT